eukprot:gene6108-5970_t
MHTPLHILWQDEHMVAVYKPAGWLVHRTGLDAGETRFVMQTLRDQLGQHVFPVHRLDKGTCGVLVMALHSDAARALSQAFEQHATHKRYLAMVRGWAPAEAEVDHPLRPDDAPPDAPVQDAHTRFRTLARLTLPQASDPRFATTRAALVEAVPTTGRRHQIRRHLKHLAHPIIGDATHGKGPLNRWWAERLGQQRLWLHAWQLSLPHPPVQPQTQPDADAATDYHRQPAAPSSAPPPSHYTMPFPTVHLTRLAALAHRLPATCWLAEALLRDAQSWADLPVWWVDGDLDLAALELCAHHHTSHSGELSEWQAPIPAAALPATHAHPGGALLWVNGHLHLQGALTTAMAGTTPGNPPLPVHALVMGDARMTSAVLQGVHLHVQGDLAVQTLLWSDGAPGGLTVLGQCTAQVGLFTRGSALHWNKPPHLEFALQDPPGLQHEHPTHAHHETADHETLGLLLPPHCLAADDAGTGSLAQ